MSCRTSGIGPDRPDDRPVESGSPSGAHLSISQAHGEQSAIWPSIKPAFRVPPSVITRHRLLSHSRRARLRIASDIESRFPMTGKRGCLHSYLPTPLVGAA